MRNEEKGQRQISEVQSEAFRKYHNNGGKKKNTIKLLKITLIWLFLVKVSRELYSWKKELEMLELFS